MSNSLSRPSISGCIVSPVDGRSRKAEDGGFESPHPDQSKEAKRAYDRAWYAKQTAERKARKVDLQRERLVRNLIALRDYKAAKGCAECPERDPIVLEFDHRDGSLKDDNIGDAHHRGWSLERLMAEVAKCDVVCANCHRRRTATAFWRDLAAGSNPATQTKQRLRLPRY